MNRNHAIGSCLRCKKSIERPAKLCSDCESLAYRISHDLNKSRASIHGELADAIRAEKKQLRPKQAFAFAYFLAMAVFFLWGDEPSLVLIPVGGVAICLIALALRKWEEKWIFGLEAEAQHDVANPFNGRTK